MTADKPDKYVRQRLEVWGEWHVRGGNTNLGFPKENTLSKLHKSGGVLIRGTGHQYMPTHAEAEEIEAVVCELHHHEKKRAMALQVRYFNPDQHEHVAICSGYTRTQYYTHLKLAHEWVKGYLSANKKNKIYFL